ncbi:MAG: hypothetical protein M3347_02435 [Armatimonadota bacterium]|nr:hypothetical protein [Armatimonadota bacterium]
MRAQITLEVLQLRNNRISRIGNVVFTGAALVTMGAALSATAGKALATDSGLGFYNATDIYPKGNFHLDVDTFGRGIRTDVGTSVGLEYGLGPDRDGIFGRTEFGFDYSVSPSGASPEDRILFNVKTQLYNNDASKIRATAGLSGLGTKNATAAYTATLLGSKAFEFGRVHAGLFKNIERNNSGVDNAGVQLAFDKAITPRVIVGADWRSGRFGFLAPFLIWNMNDKAGFEVGIGRANKSSVVPRHQTYIAFDYNFDFGNAHPAPPSTPAAPAGPGGGG